MAYSEGFSPRPKLSFGLALSVGHESEAEYLDIELTERIDVERLPEALTDVLPDGIAVERVIELESGAASLQQAITSCTWRLEVLGAPTDVVAAAVAETLAGPEVVIERTRKGKTVNADVRPAILHLEVVGPTEFGVELLAELGTQPVSLRPAELTSALGLEALRDGRVRRTHQWIMIDGIRHEPVSMPDPSMRPLFQEAS